MHRALRRSLIVVPMRTYTPGGPTGPVRNVSVLGSGLMGSGIAQVAAQRGFTVTLWDMDDKLVAGANVRVQKGLERVLGKQFAGDTAAAQKAVAETMGRIRFTSSINEAAKSPQLIVEAIIENLKIKQDLFAKLDKMSPANTIFASNTSSLEISRICNGVRPSQFGGVHFV